MRQCQRLRSANTSLIHRRAERSDVDGLKRRCPGRNTLLR